MSSFAFSFPGGRLKRSDEMTREELLEVIDHMIQERNWWRDEAKGADTFYGPFGTVRGG